MSKITFHYIWFENYLNFHNQGVNLSSKYTFSYNPDSDTITIKDNSQNYIDNFFGDNITLTAIVGQNGVGKTSILRFIQGLRHGDLIQNPCLIICEQDDEFWAGRYYYDTNQIKCKTINIPELPNIIPQIKPNEMQRFPFSNNVRFIYLTEMFNTWQYASALAGGDDISFASILYNQTEFGEEEKHINNPVVRYIHRITDWQLAFLSNGRKYVEQFKINYPSHVFISPSYDRDAFTNLYIRLKSNNDSSSKSEIENNKLKEEARHYLRDFLHGTDYEALHSIKDEYAIAILMNIISSFHFVLSPSKDQGKQLYNIMNQKIVFEGATCAWDVVYELLAKIKQANDYCDHALRTGSYKKTDEIFQFSIDANAYIEFMDYFSESLEALGLFDTNSNFPYTVMISTLTFERIYDFFNFYKKCIRIVDFISFSWGLSSGENLILNQFGKLMHLFKENKNGKYYLPEDVNGIVPAQNAIILLDEAEVAFHPEWQRLYLGAMLNYLQQNVVESGTHLQLILATHSPIILSDIPKQNSVFIEKDIKNNSIDVVAGDETFAANIFSLYQNAFFLDGAGIGALAEKKLCELIDKIHMLYGTETDPQIPSESQKDEVIKRINCIGDPYIRHKFEMEYKHLVYVNENTDGKKSELDREIAEARKKLEKLQKQRRKLGE